jgi:aspartyl-tRNA(Asn)/glutamyl-tRNA(Gln) amidotransferase subunit A
VSRTIRELSAAYRSGEASPVAATRENLERISSQNSRLNSFITILGEQALKAAEESEERFKKGSAIGLLDGVPIAVKDVFYIEGVKCTAGSKILADNIAGYDSSAVRSLKAAGAVIVGTTNMHEFAAGVTSVNPHYGAVRNPWDVSCVAGGSSGGSAVAVASGMAEGAIGTDTAGSVRIPAAFCGVLGLKPTYGRISRLGVVPLASSLDTVGTLSRSAWDAAVMLQAMAGPREGDITTSDTPVPDFLQALSKPFAGARVGVPAGYFHDEIDAEVEESFSAFLSKIRQVGCTTEVVDLGDVGGVYGKWLTIRRAEATAFHQKWLDTAPELYGDDVRMNLDLGKGVLAVDYVNALNSRPSVIESFSRAMGKVDFLAVPSTRIAAPRIGQTEAEINGRKVAVYSALNSLTLPFNYVGFPAISIPSGLVRGVPVGAQIVGKLFDEASVLGLAQAYETRFGLFPQAPGIT